MILLHFVEETHYQGQVNMLVRKYGQVVRRKATGAITLTIFSPGRDTIYFLDGVFFKVKNYGYDCKNTISKTPEAAT